MVKYYVNYNDLLNQVASLQNISRIVASYETRINSIASSMDTRDRNMASLKSQLRNCGKAVAGLTTRYSKAGNTLSDISSKYLAAENECYGLFSSSDTIENIKQATIQMSSIPVNDLILDDTLLLATASKELLSLLNKPRKFIGGLDDLLEVLDLSNSTLDVIKKSKIYNTIKYLNDANKLIDALNSGDFTEIGELLEKYIKKAGKSVLEGITGTSGFTSVAYVNLAWNFFENAWEVDKYASKGDLVGYVWNCTGGTILETGVEIGFDIVEDIGGFLGYDINKAYEDLVGVGGVEGFYKATGQLADELFGDYYKKGGIGGAIEGTANLIGDTISWWGSKISSWFK